MFTRAITRKPGRNFSLGITTTKDEVHSYELIIRQHEAYTEILRSIGLEVIALESLLDYPDGYFVEDTAVVNSDVAVITNPGAVSRKGEVETMAAILAKYRETERIQAPGTLDGGDVLMVESHFLIGISERTNQEGAEQFGRVIERFDNTWTSVPVVSGLHLKSSINYVGKNTLLVTEEFAGLNEIKAYNKIIVDREEEYACNTLLVNDHLIMPEGFPGTRTKLETLGFGITELDVSEVRKMDGGLTCMSIRF
jgi:dimethylargininase